MLIAPRREETGECNYKHQQYSQIARLNTDITKVFCRDMARGGPSKSRVPPVARPSDTLGAPRVPPAASMLAPQTSSEDYGLPRLFSRVLVLQASSGSCRIAVGVSRTGTARQALI